MTADDDDASPPLEFALSNFPNAGRWTRSGHLPHSPGNGFRSRRGCGL